MVAISINQHGAVEVERMLTDVSESAADISLAWRRVYLFILAAEQKQFSYGGVRGPNPWPPLSPVTIATKRRKGLRLKKMHATEALATDMREFGSPTQIWRAGGYKAEFGSQLIQFLIQQNNEDGSHMPFRPPVDLTDMDVRKITNIIHRAIVESSLRRTARLP